MEVLAGAIRVNEKVQGYGILRVLTEYMEKELLKLSPDNRLLSITLIPNAYSSAAVDTGKRKIIQKWVNN